MPEVTSTVWVAIGLALPFLAAWLAVSVDRRRLASEAPARLTVTALSLLAPLEARVADLERRLTETETALQTEREAREADRRTFRRRLAEQQKLRTQLEARVLALEAWIRANTEYDPAEIP